VICCNDYCDACQQFSMMLNIWKTWHIRGEWGVLHNTISTLDNLERHQHICIAWLIESQLVYTTHPSVLAFLVLLHHSQISTMQRIIMDEQASSQILVPKSASGSRDPSILSFNVLHPIFMLRSREPYLQNE